MSVTAANLLKQKELVETIEAGKVVSLRFRISDEGSGELLQYGDDLVYLHGGYGGAFPKVEEVMKGCAPGERVTVSLSPEEGYGHRDPALVLRLPVSEFGEAVPEMGESVEGQLPSGKFMMFTVTGCSDEQVTVDGNHPFAGKNLSFEFEVIGVRDSIEAERAAGFAFDGMLG